MAFGKPGSGDIMREEVAKARRATRKRKPASDTAKKKPKKRKKSKPRK